MSKFRLIKETFWTDDTVAEVFSAEEKYFYLYLITNPNSHQCGVSHLPTRIIAFETGLERKTIEALLDKFINKYKKILYNYETQEVAILNFLKHSVEQGGIPFEDCLESGLAKVVDSSLAAAVYRHSYGFMNNDIATKKAKFLDKAKNASSDSKKDIEPKSRYESVKKVFERYFETIGYDINNELSNANEESINIKGKEKRKENINGDENANENKNKRDVPRVVPLLADNSKEGYPFDDDELPF